MFTRRGKKFMILLIGMFVSVALNAAWASSPPKVINLRIANYFPVPAKQSTLLAEFAKELEERTGGRVKTSYYPAETLLSGIKMFEGVAAGIADIGYSQIFHTPGRMLISESAGMPLGYPSAWVGGQVWNDFYQKFKPKEWDQVHVLWLNTCNPNVLFSTKPVRKLEDMKGVILRAPGRIGDVVRALGGTPAPTPTPEVYDSVAKGVITGGRYPLEVLKTWRFAEVAKYVTVSWQVGEVYPFYLVMNKDSYKKLPPDIKDLFDDLAGKYHERYLLMWNSIDFAGKKFGLEKGLEFIELSPEEAPRWKKAVEPVIEGYVKEMVGKGYPEVEVRSWIKFLRERIDFWTAKQIEWTIPSPTGPAEMRPEVMFK